MFLFLLHSVFFINCFLSFFLLSFCIFLLFLSTLHLIYFLSNFLFFFIIISSSSFTFSFLPFFLRLLCRRRRLLALLPLLLFFFFTPAKAKGNKHFQSHVTISLLPGKSRIYFTISVQHQLSTPYFPNASRVNSCLCHLRS